MLPIRTEYPIIRSHPLQVLIGGLGGIWLNHVFSGPAGVLTAACLQGIACGTFLFVTTMEVR